MLQLLWQVIICTHILGHGPAMWQQFREAVRLKEPMWHKKSNNIFKQIHMHSISQLVNARCAQNCNLSMLAHWLQHWLKNKIWCVGSPLANKHWEGHWGEEQAEKAVYRECKWKSGDEVGWKGAEGSDRAIIVNWIIIIIMNLFMRCQLVCVLRPYTSSKHKRMY